MKEILFDFIIVPVIVCRIEISGKIVVSEPETGKPICPTRWSLVISGEIAVGEPETA